MLPNKDTIFRLSPRLELTTIGKLESPLLEVNLLCRSGQGRKIVPLQVYGSYIMYFKSVAFIASRSERASAAIVLQTPCIFQEDCDPESQSRELQCI
jgi:hypothetical protein